MATIKDTPRLLSRVLLANMMAPQGEAITPVLSGKHGIGKSAIIKAAAKNCGGYAITVEGGSLKEGEITGLPFVSRASDGTNEVRFVKYYAISNIAQLEKEYYNRANNEGFINGTVRRDKDGGEYYTVGGKEHKIEAPTEEELIIRGEDNIYKFGNNLPSEIKIKLLESGEIKPVFLFIDEINRTELQTMKELMNIVLNRQVNGYDLPWWVMIVSAINPASQNSIYAANEMDEAQLSRFLYLKVEARLDEWVDFALDENLNEDIIIALTSAGEEVFNNKHKGQEDREEIKADPRSWSMVSHIYNSIKKYGNHKFIPQEEWGTENEDLITLMAAKVGATNANIVIQNIKNKEDDVRASEILTGKSDKISPEILAKINRQKMLRKKITSDRVIRWLSENITDLKKSKVSAKPEEKLKYANTMSQFAEYVNSLDSATQFAFVKKITQPNVTGSNGRPLYADVASYFSKEVLSKLFLFRKDYDDLSKK